MKTQKVNKSDCSFETLNHAVLGGNTGMWKQIKMIYEGRSYFMYNSQVAFRHKDQVASFSTPRKVSKCEGKRIIERLPEQIEIFI